MPDPGHTERALIDGRLVSATDGGTFDNINPATEESIGTTPDCGHADRDVAIAAARRAFDATSWSTDHTFRVQCLRQLQEALTKNADELRAALVAEIGTPVALTHGPQLDVPVSGLGRVANLAAGYASEEDPVLNVVPSSRHEMGHTSRLTSGST
jgi:aldehyde dehydrogenase (NAD+)